MMDGAEEPVPSEGEGSEGGGGAAELEVNNSVAPEILIRGVNAKLGKEQRNGKLKKFRKFTFSLELKTMSGTVLATHLISKRFSEFCEVHEFLSRKRLWRSVAPPTFPPKYPLKDMVADKSNVQKRFNEMKRYFTRVFNDPADVGSIILNPLLAQAFELPEDFVELLPKVAAERKELGEEWSSRKVLSVKGGMKTMKSADARQQAFMAGGL